MPKGASYFSFTWYNKKRLIEVVNIMDYRALYRKYRPIVFDDIVGQEVIIKTLINAVKTKRISHAYLFSGSRGTGKTSVAKLLAKAINCLDAKNGQTCNKCFVCLSVINNESPDIIEIDAASNNGIDEIRELKNKINLAPHHFRYKVYIVDEVHMLSIGAFNALLKTLEEPPAHAVFILATTEPHKLPLTIVSRCQNFNFQKISVVAIETKLKEIIDLEKIKIDKEVVTEIAKLADGSLRDAIGLLEQLNAYTDKKISMDDIYEVSGTVPLEKLAKVLKYWSAYNLEELFGEIENFYQTGKDFQKITESLAMFLRNILLYRRAPTFFNQLNHDLNLYKQFNDYLSDDLIFRLINDANVFLLNIKDVAHPKIAFELLLLRRLDNVRNISSGSGFKESISDIKLPPKENLLSGQKIKYDASVIKDKKKPQAQKKDYKEILIHNTIALAEKKHQKAILSKWDQLNTYLINKEYRALATLLLDSKVEAASADHLILTYEYDAMVESFDQQYNEIESLINNLLGQKYIVVALNKDDWQVIRNKYIKLKKEKKVIELLSEEGIERQSNFKKTTKAKKLSQETKDAIEIFGEDLIEMKG